MADDRRRQLRDEEFARIARAIDQRARATHSAPILGGLDAATYALDIDIGGERRELVARIFTLPVHRDGAAARRYAAQICGVRSFGVGRALSAVGTADRHPASRLDERREAVSRVEAMRVFCGEQDVAQALEVGMRHHGVHELPCDAFSPMVRQYEDVAEPRERRAIGHHSSECDLPRATIGVAVERRKADRPVYRPFDDVARNARRPVRLVVKKPPHELAVDVFRIARDDVRTHPAATLDSLA
jgi:hypothetical protein